MEDCIFCKIGTKKIHAEIVYEDDGIVAFLDIRPMAPGHTVVIPKHHAATLPELPDEKIAPLFLSVKRVAEKLGRALSPDGFTYGINQGKASGQEVRHLHIHVVPRWEDDGGRSFQSVVHNAPKEDLKEIGEKIRNA